MTSVCAVGAGSLLNISAAHGGATTANNTVDGPTTSCIRLLEVGALPDNRGSNNQIDIAEPMDCD
jgi:hypothetical protein